MSHDGYQTSDEEEVQRALEEWSLSSSAHGGGAWSDSTGVTSVDDWSQGEDGEPETPIEFLQMLFPHR